MLCLLNMMPHHGTKNDLRPPLKHPHDPMSAPPGKIFLPNPAQTELRFTAGEVVCRAGRAPPVDGLSPLMRNVPEYQFYL
jgi:hypothetical protein